LTQTLGPLRSLKCIPINGSRQGMRHPSGAEVVGRERKTQIKALIGLSIGSEAASRET